MWNNSHGMPGNSLSRHPSLSYGDQAENVEIEEEAELIDEFDTAGAS
jgi:hypothetical protein